MRATAKNLRISARKLGLVASLVRGRSVADAEVILQHTPKKGAEMLLKVVKSAAANAENNDRKDVKQLEIESILVSNAGIMKRIRPVSRGRAHRIHKRLSHVTVTINSEGKE